MSNAREAAFRCQIKSGRLCLLHSGNIYDVTDFVDRHPGGREVIENHVGQDVTQVMKTQEFHKHSPAALRILDKYYIGEYNSSNGTVHRHKGKSHADGRSNNHADGQVNGYKNGLSAKVSSGSAKNFVVQYDDLVDWSKPIFWQVGSLGDKYMDWVHSPIDTSLRLFHNDFVETFSKAYWWTVPPFWVPILLMALWDSYSRFQTETINWNIIGLGDVQVSTMLFPVLFFLGFLLWTIVEYMVHRWIFHSSPPADSKFLITVHFLLHGQHHKSPMDKTRLVFPHVPACCLAVIIYFIYSSLAPVAVAHVILAGTILGYICYDLTHYYLHHGNPSLKYFRDLKTYHVKHHFKTQDQGFGISSKIWDFPFGTLIR